MTNQTLQQITGVMTSVKKKYADSDLQLGRFGKNNCYNEQTSVDREIESKYYRTKKKKNLICAG